MKRTITNFSILKYLFLGILTALLFVGSNSTLLAQTTININATGITGSYITGSVDAAGTKNDGDMINMNSLTNRGWATFDLSSIPATALITAVTLNFTTTSASTGSTATNFIYGFNGDPATMAGTALYTACGTGVTLDASIWSAGALNSKIFSSAGLTFVQTNIGQAKVNLGFERGSTNMYHIYGYGAASTQQPQLSITYVLQSNCTGTPLPGTTVSSSPSVCAGSNLDLSLQNSFTGQYGITYQWQTSSNGTSFTNSLNDTLPTFTTTQTATTYYQCIVGCSFTSNSGTSSAIQVSQNGPTSCYCSSSANFIGDEEIFGVQFGSLNNTSNCSTTAPGAGSVNQLYSNYTTLTPVDFTKGLSYNLGVTINTCGSFYGEDLAVFIDFNQDGDYLDAGENVYTSPYAPGTAGAVRGGSVTIPCNALTGNTGMRVVYTEGGGSTSCGSYGYGETEDYLINIVDNPLTYLASAAVQQSGIVSPNASNRAILRVPVAMAGCGIATATNFVFNTAGTTNVSDIASAKLYRTDNSKTFSTSHLLGTIANPSGAMVFAISDTLLNNDTTNYWLAYDINAGATIANTVDARIDSIEIYGAYRLPINSNPAGNVIINSPMTFVNAEATQSLLSKVESGSSNNRILGMKVVTSTTGASINLTQFDLSANGTTDTSDISNIKVWYTGNSSTFATTNQFGATLPSLSGYTFSITGTQGLNNDTNYFWLTYDINPSSTVGNVIDAEFISATLAGTPQTPAITAPVGNRQIRAPYCTSSATNTGDEEIFGVQFGALNNTSDCSSTAPGAGSVNLLYSNYTTLSPVSFTKGLSYNLGVTINTCGPFGSFYGEDVAVFIDYNQDGDFLDIGENVYTSPFLTGTANAVRGGSVSIPCDASSGETRMRVVYTEGGGSSSCGTYGYGETEDYLINIVENPLTYLGTIAFQQTGVVSPSTSDRPILMVPIAMTGCGAATVTNFVFNTAGSTNAADITAAKLYRTDNNLNFSTSKLIATIPNPSGSFVFTVNDTLMNNDTTNYWLAYDVNASATLSNVLDARYDSAEIFGSYRIPFNSNPAGNVVINSPMTFVSANATQTLLTKVESGSINNQILGMEIITSATGAAINLTQFDLSVNGTTDTSNIRNIKVWYTGNSNTFATTNQFGSTLPTLSATTFNITGIQGLTNGSNYFWLTYDINPSATVGNVIDAEFISATIASTSQTPITTAPSGSRQIRAPYCVSSASNTGDEEIFGVQFGALNTTSNCSTIAPGPGSNNQLYSNYTTLAPVSFTKGLPYNLGVTINTCGGFYGEDVAVFIDYNQDGDFLDAGENIYTSPFANGTAGAVRGGTISIPCDALLGETRMRVVYTEGGGSTSCGNYSWGETEDYLINIVDNPLAYAGSTAIQQTGVVSPGAADRAILRVPVAMSGCGIATASNFVFNTAGSTNVGDIAAAKLYRTDNSQTFATTKLLASISNPSGSIVFAITDTLLNNDTTNYWLAYDMNAGATLANFVDARLDSIEILGAYRTPFISNPVGNITINSPMTFVSANATQSLLSKVESGTSNNRIIGMEIVTSATGASINLTQFNLSANGTTDTSDISNIKVWYTGNSNAFATTTQFGATLPSLSSATFSITGTQGLSNGTNYFWLTYDVNPSATVGNLIDAEFISVTISGTPQTPATSAPAGSRQIKAPYCPSSANFPFDEEIFGVQFGGFSNTSNCGSVAPGGGSVNQSYSNYTTLSPFTYTKGNTYNLGVTINTCGAFYGENVAVFIDYNQDGDFLDADENIYTSAFSTGSANLVLGGNITIPCNASLGETRMRVVYAENGGATSCGTYDYGETEDYMINITDNPLAYIGTEVSQPTAAVAPGTSDVSILRIPVKASGCGLGLLTEFNFNTIGTTNVANITSAKLYATGNSSTFSTSKLLSTVLSPSGHFSFVGLNDTLLTGQSDTNNYWLAYDVVAGATLGNLLDARVDSINVLGQYRVPTNNNPIGARTVDAPMTYVSSTTTQTANSKVERSSTNNQIIGLEVVTSAIGSPIILSNIDVSTNGTSSVSDITNLKVWYTGNSNTFAAATQFGSTIASPSATQSVSGITNLANGTNYFWITYDISASATIGNLIDAEITSTTVNGITQTPTVTSPSGSRMIKSNYVSPTYSNGTQFGIYIGNVQIGSINNTTTGAPAPYVTFFDNLSTNINCGSSNTLLVTPGTFAGNNIAAWIDYNNDGVYASTEKLGEYTNIGSAPSFATFNFFAPINASIGATRMRVISAYNVTNISPTGTGFTYGETEDYVINLLPATAAGVYTWNQTGSGDFTLANNWTPSRTNPSLTDKLIFSNGGNITVTNLSNQIISSVSVSNNTNVTLSAVSNTVFGAYDSLNLTSGKLIAGSNVIISVGIDTNTTGVLTGTGSLEGSLRRWIKSGNNNINFPLSVGANSRNASFSYTTAPSVSGMLTGQFVTSTPSSFGLPLTEGSIVLKRAAINGYWNFAASNGLSGGTYDVTLTAQGFTGVQDYTTLVMLKRLSTINQWTLEGTHVTTIGSNSSPVLSRTGLSGYGNFGVGGDTLFNTLPVTLVSLSAKNINGDAVISWTTSTEVNNKGFEVERSFNGRTFSKINFVKGAVNSSVLHNYFVSDNNVFANNNASVIYYRLKQVDLNGKFTYSDVVSVSTDNIEAEDNIKSFPNPFSSDININITAKAESTVNVSIFDIRGQLVHSSSFVANQGEGIYKVENLDGLAGGIYFVRVESNGELKTIKMTKLN